MFGRYVSAQLIGTSTLFLVTGLLFINAGPKLRQASLNGQLVAISFLLCSMLVRLLGPYLLVFS